jgi:hypothetical protein
LLALLRTRNPEERRLPSSRHTRCDQKVSYEKDTWRSWLCPGLSLDFCWTFVSVSFLNKVERVLDRIERALAKNRTRVNKMLFGVVGGDINIEVEKGEESLRFT